RVSFSSYASDRLQRELLILEEFLRGGCFCRRGLVETDFGHELGEARVGAERVGHWVSIQVDEAVDLFVVGEVEEAKGFVGFAETDMNGGGIHIGDEAFARKLL